MSTEMKFAIIDTAKRTTSYVPKLDSESPWDARLRLLGRCDGKPEDPPAIIGKWDVAGRDLDVFADQNVDGGDCVVEIDREVPAAEAQLFGSMEEAESVADALNKFEEQFCVQPQRFIATEIEKMSTETQQNDKQTFTPAPWIFDGENPKVYTSSHYIAMVGGDGTNAIENARLIAAAPELLEQEEENLAWIENLLGDIAAGRSLKPQRIAEGLTIRRDAIRAAIAKATGAK